MPVVPFGNYLLDELIAEGGMARVYRARLRGALGFEKPLVVKQVRPELASDPRFVQMFAEEAKTLVRLGHPHIVPVYELGVVDGVYFIAMEYVEGAPLSAILEDGPLPPAHVARLGLQIAEALDHAHQRYGLVHRDVTPRNVLIDDDGNARLVDFGIATAPDPDGPRADAFGSPGYMSPEQAMGGRVGPQSDLFSMACVLYRALTGETLFPEGRSLHATEPVVIDSPLVAAPIAALMERMLVRDPESRLDRAHEVARTLRGWLAKEHPEGAGRELGIRAREARERRGHGSGVRSASRPSGRGGEAQLLATSPLVTAALAASREVDGDARQALEPFETARIEPAPIEPAPIEGTAPIPGRRPSEPTAHAQSAKSKPRSLAGWIIAGAVVAAAGVLLMARDTAHVPMLAEVIVEAQVPDAQVVEANVGEPVDPVPEPPPEVEVEPDAPIALVADPPRIPRGSVTINATPWAQVRIDGREVGVTPQRRIALEAGPHQLELSNPPLGRDASARLTVEPGQSIQVFGDLTQDPGVIRVR